MWFRAYIGFRISGNTAIYYRVEGVQFRVSGE